MIKKIFLSTILILVIFTMQCAKVNIVGEYNVRGKAGDKSYTGVLNIEKRGDVYQVTWELPNGEAYDGIGIVKGDHFAVSYADPDFTIIGVVLYKIKKNYLTGVWATPGTEDDFLHGTEIAYKGEFKNFPEYSPEPPKYVFNGEYVVEGVNPDGSEYKARTKVIKMKDYYGVMWEAKSNFYGVGIADGDMLVIGWFAESDTTEGTNNFGVALLQSQSSKELKGPWGIWGVNEKGKEVWTKME